MSETTDKIVDKIVGDATSRLKIPIVSTYLCVLMINNWDILYFLMFSKIDATSKILYIKNHYNILDYIWRVGGSLLYAVGILVLFTFLDYYLVKCLKNVSIKKKGLQQQIVDHSSLEDMKKVIDSVRVENNKLHKRIEEYKKDEVSYAEEITELNSRYSDIYEYARFGQFIQEINIIPKDNIHSTFYYLEKLLKEFRNYEEFEIIGYEKLMEVLGNSNNEKFIYNEILNALQKKDYIVFDERIKKEKLYRSIAINENDIDYLFLYLNIK